MRSPEARSAVTNEKRTTLFADGRSAGSRRYRDLLASFAAELGGMDALPESSRQMVRRAAQSSIECELCESARADGRDIDPIAYATVSNNNRRALEALAKLKRTHKPPRKTIAEHLAATYAASSREAQPT